MNPAKALVFGGRGFTFDPDNKAASITLSGANRVAERTSGNSSYAAALLTPRPAGIVTVVMTLVNADAVTEMNLGVCNASFALTDHYFGDANTGAGFYQDGRVFIAGALDDTIDGWVSGDTVTLQANIRDQEMRRKINAGSWSSWYSFAAVTGPYKLGANTYRDGDSVTITP